ncbi:hypothetical protein [Microbacterium album]|uniref:Uncharacterized protein n=1 Tax=Microbacterium album TaxID=2053191 RepID=A0A917MKF6_9MICO|nr:hypothetical protein [Microbacterium album]GGH36460.1 hypothetical protein GCM10010921_05640 [Microbacterium album]
MSTPEHGDPHADPHAGPQAGPQGGVAAAPQGGRDERFEAQRQAAEPDRARMPLLIRGAIWIAIGALIAAAIVCVVWVLIGDQNQIIGKAFLTILLLAGFAGVALLDASMAEKRPSWLVLASMVSWVIVLLVGAVKIWAPVATDAYGYRDFVGVSRLWELILVVGLLQLALLHQRLFWRAHERHVTTFTRTIALVTTVLLGALVALLVFFLTFPDAFDYPDLYWRIVVALAILTAVGTTLIPLLNALFAPKRPRQQQGSAHGLPGQPATPYPGQPATPYPGQPATPYPGQPGAAYTGQVAGYGAAPVEQQLPPAPPAQWPTYADGRTPLPSMPDGSPDWNAYYTGVPSYPQQGAWPPAGDTAIPGASAASQDAPAPPYPPHDPYGQQPPR